MSRYSDAISDFAENEDCSPVDAVAVNPSQNTGHYAEPELTRIETNPHDGFWIETLPVVWRASLYQAGATRRRRLCCRLLA
jgi:hypothetical protein